jgi:CRISPR-associated protein Cmr1
MNITFTCEVVTPMFLAGADGIEPALRPPSIKGAMRFWWRAMHGYLPIDDIKMPDDEVQKGLRSQETEIFGGGGENARRSQVTIRIKQRDQLREESTLWEEIPHDIKRNKNGEPYNVPKSEVAGIHYLLYSAFMNERGYFKAGSTFELSLDARDIYALKETINAFSCLVYFGGIGSRTRRGAGSISIKKIEGSAISVLSETLKIFDTRLINNRDDLVSHLYPIISSTSTHGKYSTLNGAKIFVFNHLDNWEKALESLGRPFKDYRFSVKGDISDTPNFGFPINHSGRNGGLKAMMIAGKKLANKTTLLERRASPVIFKVIKASEERYFPVIIWLSGELIPNGYEIMDKNCKQNKVPSDKIIQEFLDSQFGGGKMFTPDIIY